MFKYWISIKKEFLMLFSDKAGLAMMFFMPVLMVYIITIVQDGAFKVVNENRISLLLVNADTGESSVSFSEALENSHFFDITIDTTLAFDDVKQEMLDGGMLTALYIPDGFSESLKKKSDALTGTLLSEVGLSHIEDRSYQLSNLHFFNDPVIQESYCNSILNLISTLVKREESRLIIENICAALDLKDGSKKLEEVMKNGDMKVEQHVASFGFDQKMPNSSQHNVPAWTIFAMFFMVISLGGNLVKEKMNGSFLRLKTMPTSFGVVLLSKVFVFVMAVYIQVGIVFILTKNTFPLIGLPEIDMPSNMLAFFVVIFFCAITAIGFATVVGILSKTQEQANGFGAVSVVILAALGGVWVPKFVMPGYLQVICNFSPLSWCMESFYVLFLKNGSWFELLPYLGSMLVFSLVCFIITFVQLRKNRLI